MHEWSRVDFKNFAADIDELRSELDAGVGVEAAITDSLIGRVELRHTDLGTETYALDLGPTDVSSSSNALLLGVGMKF